MIEREDRGEASRSSLFPFCSQQNGRAVGAVEGWERRKRNAAVQMIRCSMFNVFGQILQINNFHILWSRIYITWLLSNSFYDRANFTSPENNISPTLLKMIIIIEYLFSLSIYLSPYVPRRVYISFFLFFFFVLFVVSNTLSTIIKYSLETLLSLLDPSFARSLSRSHSHSLSLSIIFQTLASSSISSS